MSNINIEYISPTLRIISLTHKHLIIANTANGVQLGYLPNAEINKKLFIQFYDATINADDECSSNETALIKKLYKESLDYQRNIGDKIAVILRLKFARNLQTFNPHIFRFKNNCQQDIQYGLEIKINVNPKKNEKVLEWINDFSNQFEEVRKIFEKGISVQLMISANPDWSGKLTSFLDQVFVFNFLNLAIYFQSEFMFKDKADLIWLEELQNSGYSLPFVFEDIKLLKRKEILEFIQWALKEGVAKSIEIDASKLLMLTDKEEQRKKIDDYHNFLIWWMEESEAPALSLINIVRLITALTSPIKKEFYYVLGSKFSCPKALSKEFLSKYWEQLCSYSPLLGPIFPNLLPVHFFNSNDGKTVVVGEKSLKQYCRIIEDCITWIIEVMFAECEKSLEANRPLILDLNQAKPRYQPVGWELARSIAHQL